MAGRIIGGDLPPGAGAGRAGLARGRGGGGLFGGALCGKALFGSAGLAGGGEPEEVADRIENALRRGVGGEEFGDAGLGEALREVAGNDMGFVAQGMVAHGVQKPGFAGGQARLGRAGCAGGRAACVGRAGAGGVAAGDAGHQAGEALGGAAEAGAVREEAREEQRMVDESADDQRDEVAHDLREARREGLGQVVCGAWRFGGHVILNDILC